MRLHVTAQPTVRRTASALPLPLTTSKMANQLSRESPKVRKARKHLTTATDILQKMKSAETDVLGVLMAKLNEQQQNMRGGGARVDDDTSSSTTDPFTNTPPGESSATSDSQSGPAEVDLLKKQLELATERMVQMDLELTQSRLARHTVEQAIGSPFPAAQELAYNAFGGAQTAFNGPVSRRPSPLDMGAPAQQIGMNGMINGGAMMPAPFFRGNG